MLELINGYSKFIGYKINTQKSLAFLYTEKSEREIKKTIPFTIATKRIKYLRINLSQETKDRQRSLAGYHPWGHESDMTQDGTTRKASPHPEDQSQVTDYETV